jgi:glutamine amidotransferase PdxT
MSCLLVCARLRSALARQFTLNVPRVLGSVFILFFVCSLGVADAAAATYYVDNTNGLASDNNAGTSASLPWKTLAKAASRLVAGDTVIVLPGGSYDERVLVVNSGSSTSRITYTAAAGARPKVRGFTMTGKNYITIDGFEITHSGLTPDAGAGIDITGSNHIQILNNHIHDTVTTSVIFGNSTFIRISGNTISHAGALEDKAAIGSRFNQPNSDILIENNQMSYVGDFVNPYGTRYVIRSNSMGPSRTTNVMHIDGVQANGVTTKSILEGNLSIDNASTDNHLFLNQIDQSDGWIIRYNVTLRSKGGLDLRDADGHFLYNNTFFDNRKYYTNSFQILMTNSTGNIARNNIWFNASSGNPYSVGYGSSLDKDYDLWFNQGNPGGANSVNADPRFMDAAGGDLRLQANSPAIGAGGPISHVLSTDSGGGMLLYVANVGAFQDGWAGVSPDWIAIGTSGNAAQIQSIDYNAGTITLATPIARSPGQPVWLYKNSNGVQVLHGGAPDIGAFEFIASGPDTIKPITSITAPAGGATVSGSSVTVSANATDNVGVVGVQFKIDGVNAGAEDTTVPYSGIWNTTTFSNGSHTITVVARDAAGNQTTSATVTVNVNNSGADTALPTASISSPAAGATVSGASVVVSANAADNVGVAGVQFKVDGVSIGAEDTTAPYSVPWNSTTASNGTHTLTAVARDAAGNQKVTAAVTVTVNNSTSDTSAPTVSVTSPAGGVTVSGASVAVSATASDNIGVVGVQFKIDGVNIGAEDTTAPFSVAWNTTTTTNGSHAITAVARDAAGNQKLSAAVAVTVNNPTSDMTLPAVSITSPANGVTVKGTAVAVTASASDNVGVVGVQFRIDGVNLGAEDTTAPYAATWNTTTASNGTHTITAIARDAAGNKRVSTGVTVAVSNTTSSTSSSTMDTIAPSVSISSHVNNARVTGTGVVLRATASDNVGVVGVRFFIDGVAVGVEDTSSPYTYTWNTKTVSNGSHAVTAIARDAMGNRKTAATISIIVKN